MLSSFNVAEDNPKYKSIDGVLYQKNYNSLELFILPCAGFWDFTVPDSVSAIKSGAFQGCCNLRTLTIPNSVKTYIVKSYEFDGCTELSKIVLPDNAVIEEYAFTLSAGQRKNLLDRYETFYKPLPKLEELSVKSLSIPLGRCFPYVENDSENYYHNTPSDAKKLRTINPITGSYDPWDRWLPDNFKKITVRDQDEFTQGAFFNLNSAGVKLELLGKKTIKKLYWSSLVGTDVDELVLADTVSLGIDDIFYKLSFPKLKKFIARGIKSLPVGFFGYSPALEYLEIPFAGAGSISSTTHFGQLFTTGEGMRAITQYTESGGTIAGCIPATLKELVLSEGCEMIPYGGLSGCNTIEKLTLPTSLYLVGDKGLYGCAKMSDIYCKGADPAVAFEHSFDGMRLSSCKVHIPYNTLDIYKNSEGWSRFYNFEEEAELKVNVIKSIEEAGVVYGLNEYRPGQIAELKAVANSGYTFVGWMEDSILLAQDATLTFTVADSRTLIALFAPLLNSNSLTLTPGANVIQFILPHIEGVENYKVELFLDVYMTKLYSSTDISMKVRNADDNVTLTVEDLKPETSYYYRISAQASGQQSDTSIVLAQYTGSFATMSDTGISDVNTEVKPFVVGIYDLFGRKLEVPVKGINFFRLSNGAMKKVIIK